jgi:hypothetical protein
MVMPHYPRARPDSTVPVARPNETADIITPAFRLARGVTGRAQPQRTCVETWSELQAHLSDT